MGITKVVYYMDPLMSKELLPDKSSAFDFNYSESQSSIWSPLVPRVHSAIDLDFEYFGFMTPKRKSLGSKSKIKKVTSNIKKKLKVAANLVKSKAKHNNNNNNNNNIKTKASEFNPSPLKPTTKVFLFLFVSWEIFYFLFLGLAKKPEINKPFWGRKKKVLIENNYFGFFFFPRVLFIYIFQSEQVWDY